MIGPRVAGLELFVTQVDGFPEGWFGFDADLERALGELLPRLESEEVRLFTRALFSALPDPTGQSEARAARLRTVLEDLVERGRALGDRADGLPAPRRFDRGL